jgi:hypothetical protein
MRSELPSAVLAFRTVLVIFVPDVDAPAVIAFVESHRHTVLGTIGTAFGAFLMPFVPCEDDVAAGASVVPCGVVVLHTASPAPRAAVIPTIL